jgi:hypothetical protein
MADVENKVIWYDHRSRELADYTLRITPGEYRQRFQGASRPPGRSGGSIDGKPHSARR